MLGVQNTNPDIYAYVSFFFFFFPLENLTTPAPKVQEDLIEDEVFDFLKNESLLLSIKKVTTFLKRKFYYS